jgi:hypothetical protein
MTPDATESYDLIVRSTVIMKSLVNKSPIISMINKPLKLLQLMRGIACKRALPK